MQPWIGIYFMMQRLFLLSVFALTAPFTLVFCLYAFFFLSSASFSQKDVLGTSNTVVYAALPSVQNTVESIIVPNDARVRSLTQFFAQYNSPLTPYASHFVEDADKYGLDYRLVPAIAFQESYLCRRALPSSPFNCYGWGITKHSTTTFTGYEEGIDIVTRSLAAWGTTTVPEIGKRYNPANTNNWVENVTSIMASL